MDTVFVSQSCFHPRLIFYLTNQLWIAKLPYYKTFSQMDLFHGLRQKSGVDPLLLLCKNICFKDLCFLLIKNIYFNHYFFYTYVITLLCSAACIIKEIAHCSCSMSDYPRSNQNNHAHTIIADLVCKVQ